MRKVILFTSLAALLLCGVVGEPLAQCTEPIPGFTLLKYVCTVKPFSNIFELVIDPKIITEYQWTQAHFDTFMNAVIDSNTSNTDDSFPLIWDYFCFTDQNLKWDEVEFRTDSGDTTTITIELWHPDDYPGGTARSAYMRVVASTSDPVLAATNRTFLHELAHVCDFANLWWTGTSEFNTWSGEQFAEGAEYLYGYPLGSGGNIFFDGSMNAVRPSDGQPNRGRFGLFHTYLFANYSGVPSDPSDDLTYNWIRNSPRNIEYYGLGHTLETMRTTYPGYDNLEAGADTMMGNLFHDFAIALYVSRSDTLGPYGFGSFDSRDTNLFDHTDSTVIRARNIPPRFILDDENLSGPIASMVYEDPEQSDSTACSPPLGRTFREFGVRRWGAEYLEFRGDESFFSTQGDTMLGIRLDPIGDLPPGTALRVGYIAYDSYDEILYDKTIVGDIQKQIAIVRPGDDPVVKFCIPNFGVTNKSVVVVISLVDDPIPLNTPNCVDSSIHCFEEGSPCDEPHLKYQLTYEYAPKILAFPGAFLNIQEAIDSAAVNQTVTIAPSPFPYEGGFTMKRGVSVVSLDPSEQPTIIDTVSSQVVLFPDFGSSPNVPDTSTVLDGIEVVGGTDAAIRFEGGGKIVNCLIDRDFDENSVAIEVNFPNRTASTAAYYAVVRDSEINLDYGTGNTGSFDGVRTRGGITEVAGTRIRMLGEAAMMSEYNGIHSEVGDPNQASVASYCLITGESGTGMRFEEDLDKAIYCTVDSTDLGYYSVGTNAVQFCIASNNSGSIYSIKGTGSVYGCITTGDIEQPATFSFQNTDPEYCGSGDYTLNYDSLGNPETNAVPPDPGDQIGAFPPACLFGTLDFDVDFDDGALPVYGDITIPVGRTLTLRQGSIVQISETDVLSSGDDSSTVEIRVYGNLTADGTSADSVFFAPPAGAGSWDGIILGADSELSLTYASIGGAKYCVRDNLTFGANIQIYSSQFYAFQTAGIYLRPIGVGQEPSICRVFNSFIDMRGAPYGIYISEQVSSQPTYEVFIGGDRSAYGGAGNTIMGDGQSVYGIYLDCEGSPPNRDARIDSMTVKSLTSGTGIYIEDYSPSLEFNEIQSCSRGIQIRGDSTPTIYSYRKDSSNFKIQNCTYGLYVADTADPTVDSLRVKNCLFGIFTDDSAEGLYSYLNVSYTDPCPLPQENNTGFQSSSDADHKLRNSKITGFFKGVVIGPSSVIDLGGNGPNKGLNEIHATCPLKYVGSKATFRPDIDAKSNYWGTSPPPANMFSSWVDYSNWLGDPPYTWSSGTGSIELDMVETPPLPLFALFPNPFKHALSVEIREIDPSHGTTIEIFDLNGRLVYLWNATSQEQKQRLTWDGTGMDGRPVSSGVYFIRARNGETVYHAKVLRLR